MKNFQKGLTLIELMAVVTMIMIVTGIVFGSYGIGNQSMALERSANKLYLDMRLALGSSMSGNADYDGVGVYFDKSGANAGQYVIFKDLNGDNMYGSGEDLYVIKIEREVIISDLKDKSGVSVNTMNINFKSPYPNVYLNNVYYQNIDAYDAITNPNGCGSPCVVSIVLRSTNGKTKTVTVNNAGKIELTN